MQPCNKQNATQTPYWSSRHLQAVRVCVDVPLNRQTNAKIGDNEIITFLYMEKAKRFYREKRKLFYLKTFDILLFHLEILF